MRLARFSILTLVAVMLATGCGNEQSRALRALDNLQSVCRNVERDLGLDFNTISENDGEKLKRECADRAQAAWVSWRRSYEILSAHAQEEWTLGESKRLSSINQRSQFNGGFLQWHTKHLFQFIKVNEYRAKLREVPNYVAEAKEVIESARDAP